jgi:hypothetical protein
MPLRRLQRFVRVAEALRSPESVGAYGVSVEGVWNPDCRSFAVLVRAPTELHPCARRIQRGTGLGHHWCLSFAD